MDEQRRRKTKQLLQLSHLLQSHGTGHRHEFSSFRVEEKYRTPMPFDRRKMQMLE